MTDQITVPRATWDAMREALEHIQRCIGFDKATIHQGSATWYEIDDAITAANAVSDHFRGVTEMVQPLGWYCVSRDGLATQCADQRDAELTAKSANRDWPNSAPYRAVQLCEFEANPKATEPAGKTRDPLDLGQYVNEANISANDKPVAVIEKLQAVINVKKGFQ